MNVNADEHKGIDDALRSGVPIKVYRGEDALREIDRIRVEAGVAGEGDEGNGALDLLQHQGRTEVANGRRLIERYGRKMRWCDKWGTWLIWDGKRWKEDDTCRADKLAKSVA